MNKNSVSKVTPIPSEFTNNSISEHSKLLIQKGDDEGKKSPAKQKSSNKLVFYCANTRYSLIKEVGKEMGWRLSTADNDNWDI